MDKLKALRGFQDWLQSAETRELVSYLRSRAESANSLLREASRKRDSDGASVAAVMLDVFEELIKDLDIEVGTVSIGDEEPKYVHPHRRKTA